MQPSVDAEMRQFYSVLAPFYDEDYALLFERRDIEFYRRMAETYGEPVLEAGCGTGRVLLPLAAAGVTMHGIEPSAEMLEQLRAKLAKEPAEIRARVSITEGDMRHADLGMQFRLITAPARVLSSFVEREDQRRFLRNVRKHLLPGGAFCFDVFQPDYKMISAPPEPMTDVDRRDPATGLRVRRTVQALHDPEFQCFRVEMRWVFEDADGQPAGERSSAVMQRWFTRAELENLLELEGFRIAGYWGGFQSEPFGRGSREQVICAEIA